MKRTKIMAGALALSLIVGSYPATVFASETQESYAEETAETKESQDEKKEEQKTDKKASEKPAVEKKEEKAAVESSAETKETEATAAKETETTAKESSKETKETEESAAKESTVETKTAEETSAKETVVETKATKEKAARETSATKKDEASRINVSTWAEIKEAFNNAPADNKVTTIVLCNHIESKAMLVVKNGMNITLDLNGYMLDRGLSKADADGHVLIVNKGGCLTIRDSGVTQKGIITGGYANNGGAVNNKGTLNIRGGRFQGNSAVLRGGAIYNHTGSVLCIEGGVFTNNSCTGDASARGGAIYNDGSLSFESGKISGNTSADCGGVFNDKNGVAVIGGVAAKSVIISNNKSVSHGGGGINNYGILSLQNCEITGNEAKTDGAGIWDNGTLEVEGEVIVKNNKKDDFFLKNGKVISLSGKLSKSSEIHVTGESFPRKIVDNWSMYNKFDPNKVFKFKLGMVLDSKGESLKITYTNRTWNGTKLVEEKSKATPDGAVIRTTLTTTLKDGWYFVDRNMTMEERLVVPAGQNNVNIVLLDGVVLNCKKGISVSGMIHIYGQTKGTGKIVAASETDNAAIGGNNHMEHGRIYIHGGNIEATGGDNGAGIGTGNKAGTGTNWNSEIHIYGGNVTAVGGNEAAGIGGGDKSANGKIFIYGGTIKATAGHNGAAIGTGDEAENLASCIDKHPINIYGGTVTAIALIDGAAIGGGNECGGGLIHIYGGTIKAEGSGFGAAIGGGDDAKANCVIIDGGDVSAFGGCCTPGIGCGYESKEIGNITINNGTVHAEGGWYGAGIGSGESTNIISGNIKITGGVVVATGGAYNIERSCAAGIGSGHAANLKCSITITGGDVTAYAGSYGGASAIGGGFRGDFTGDITISGGTVKAYGCSERNKANCHGAAIGSGFYGDMKGTITVSGGNVTAENEKDAAAIGAGTAGIFGGGKCTGTVNIKGGTVRVRVKNNKGSAVIGHGYDEDPILSGRDGDLIIYDDMMVYQENGGKKLVKASDRVTVCRNESNSTWLVITKCDHPDHALDITGETHVETCKYCKHHFDSEKHVYGDDHKCEVCGHKSEVYTITYMAGEGSGSMDSEEFRPGMSTALQDCEFKAPEGKVFKGWMVKIGDAEPVFMENRSVVQITTDITATAVYNYANGIGAVLTGNTISLDGDIAANFFMEVAPEIAASKTAYMQFTLPNGKTTKTYFKDVSYRYTDGSRICFMFKCRVSSKEMADDIKAQVIDGDRQGTVYTFNVKDYAEYILKHQEVSEYREAAPLVKAILNYGAASQKYFNYHTNNLANSGMSESDRKIKMITAKELDCGLKNASYGLEPEKVSLELESKTIMRLKFNPEAVKGATFKMGDKVLRTELSGGYLIVFVEDIKAADLFKSYLVTVDFGNKQYGVRYSPMDFFRHAIENENCKTETKELVSAMYHYAELTKAYNDKQLVC